MKTSARSTLRVRWYALVAAALGMLACKSDASVICSKLDACHLLPSGDGFDENTCVTQVESELGDSQRASCSDCVSGHGCGDVVDNCRPVCAPKVTCIDADRCPDGGAD